MFFPYSPFYYNNYYRHFYPKYYNKANTQSVSNTISLALVNATVTATSHSAGGVIGYIPNLNTTSTITFEASRAEFKLSKALLRFLILLLRS